MPGFLYTAGGGWTEMFAAELAGAGGVIADGGTVELDGVTFTKRGTGVVMTQTANGIELTRSSSTKTTLGAAISDIDADYDTRAQYIVMFRAKMQSWGSTNTNHVTAGLWRDEGSGPLEMLHGGPFEQGTTFSWTARRENAAGGFDDEQLATSYNGGTTPAYLRWGAVVCPLVGIHSIASADATEIALPNAAGIDAFGAIVEGVAPIPPVISTRRTFDPFTDLGVQAYFAGASTVYLESMRVFRRG